MLLLQMTCSSARMCVGQAAAMEEGTRHDDARPPQQETPCDGEEEEPTPIACHAAARAKRTAHHAQATPRVLGVQLLPAVSQTQGAPREPQPSRMLLRMMLRRDVAVATWIASASRNC
jgi:hypothetical protein